MKRLMLIVNPCAGKRTAKKTLLQLTALFSKNGYEVTVFPTFRSGDAAVLAETRAKGFDLIITLGGDGTLHETVTGLMRAGGKLPPLGFIPGGTTNDYAKGLKLTGSPLSVAKKILRGDPKRLDVGLFGKDRYFTYIAAFGAFTSVSYKTPQKKKNLLGHLAYIIEGIKELHTMHSYHLNIKTEDLTLEGDFIFGAATNALSVAGLVSLNPAVVGFDDGLFEVMLIKTPKNPGDVHRILKNLKKGDYDGDEILFFKAKKLMVTSDIPMEFTLDGEDGGKTVTAEITCIPGGLTLQY